MRCRFEDSQGRRGRYEGNRKFVVVVAHEARERRSQRLNKAEHRWERFTVSEPAGLDVAYRTDDFGRARHEAFARSGKGPDVYVVDTETVPPTVMTPNGAYSGVES